MARLMSGMGIPGRPLFAVASVCSCRARFVGDVAQRGLAGVAEARDEFVIGGDRVLGALQRAECDGLVEQRLGDVLAQRGLAGVAVACDELVIDGDRVLGALQRAECDGLVEQRLGEVLAQRGVAGVAKRATSSS